jgi:DNA invertase Pin-like site-specific DNA recombinase
MTSTGKLRFAVLVRVSTEEQDEEGNSLAVQTDECEADVERLGGVIVARYGGQEHGTEGWDKPEVDRLIADAGKGLFDAVIVNKTDRWSRDNKKSDEGVEAFLRHGIRFFVRTREYDLGDEDDEFSLGLDVLIGKRWARSMARRSLKSRVRRAREDNVPTSGRLPFGRTYDHPRGKRHPRGTGTGWGVDPAKQALVADVAARYLAGESLKALADEYDLNHSFLCKVLREQCGSEWKVEYRSKRGDLCETVPMTVPRLLPEETIRAVGARLEAKRTYLRKGGRKVHDYLLSGFVFCATCGHALCGKPDRHGVLHYAHTHHDASRLCPARPRPYVRAAPLEEKVLRLLFDTFGSPAHLEKAVGAAVPDRDRLLARKAKKDRELAAAEKSLARVVDAIADGLLSRDEAAAKLGKLRSHRDGLRKDLDALALELSGADLDTVARYVDVFKRRDGRGHAVVVSGEPDERTDEHGNVWRGSPLGGNNLATRLSMTRADERALVEAVFTGTLRCGDPPGVYVCLTGDARPYGRHNWGFKLRGLLPFELYVSRFQS